MYSDNFITLSLSKYLYIMRLVIMENEANGKGKFPNN